MFMPLWFMIASLLAALLVYITCWFFVSLYVKRIDVVDCAWSLGFIYLAVVTTLLVGSRGWVQWVALALVSLWGVRLCSHIVHRLLSRPEDPRYQMYRQKWGKAFWTKAYRNVFLVQGALILLVGMPLIGIMRSNSIFAMGDVIAGFILWLFGITFEGVADRQLRKFVTTQKKNEPTAVMDQGLWRYSRHPNYFGEITTWVGAGVVALGVGEWWGLVGSLTIVVLITRISGIPPLEKRYEHNPAYQEYKRHTSALFPLPRR